MIDMSFRSWVSVITLVLLAVILFAARNEIVHAWELLGQINLLILSLLIPLQLFSYFAAGEMMFSYLRAKGSTEKIKGRTQARMALEMNFVNHVLPSGGVSGISYMNWRLKAYGISAGKATAAQLVRYVVQFGAFIGLLLIAVAWITLDGNISRTVIFLSGLIMVTMLVGIVALVYLVSSPNRSSRFGQWLAKTTTRIVKTVTFGRWVKQVPSQPIIHFLQEMHDEYVTLRHDRRLLKKPLIWAVIFNLVEITMFAVTFVALGSPVSPAPILIAYGLASIAALLVVTPGGVGAFEAIMVSFLATAGVPAGVAVAGILVTRIAVLLGTIGLGYVLYQLAILRHGKRQPDS